MESRFCPRSITKCSIANRAIISRKEFFHVKGDAEVESPFPCHFLRHWRPKASLIYHSVHDESDILYEYDANRQVKNFFFEDDAEEVYLRTPPPCIVVMGKPSVSLDRLCRKLAELYDAVLIELKNIIRDFINVKNEIGELLDRILRTGNSLTVNILMALVSLKAHSPKARHRGYVLSGIPCLSVDPDIDPQQQLNYLLLWDNKPNMYINVLYDDEEILLEKERTLYLFMDTEVGKLMNQVLREEEEEFESDSEEESEAWPTNRSVKEEKNLDVAPSRPWIDMDDAGHISSELELFQQKVNPVLDILAARVDPQSFLSVDASVGKEIDIVSRLLKFLPLWRSPTAVPFVEYEKTKNGYSEDDDETKQILDLPVEEAFLKMFSTNVISTKFLYELSHYNYICPVTYKKTGEVVVGKPEFAAYFMKYIYFMQDMKSLENFLENPRFYVYPPMPKPMIRAIIVGYPCSGKTELARNLSFEFGIPLIDVNDLVKRNNIEKLKIYREFCREKSMLREKIRLTANAWEQWREEENERIALIEEWVEYLQGLLLQRIDQFYNAGTTDEADDEKQIRTHLPAESLDSGELSTEVPSKSKSEKTVLEVRGTMVPRNENRNPYDGEYAPRTDSFTTPSKKIIQAMKHENYEFNEESLEVEANLFFSTLWTKFAMGIVNEDSNKSEDFEMELESDLQSESPPSDTSEINFNWTNYLPPQSLSSLLLSTGIKTMRQKRKSFSTLLLAAKKAFYEPSVLKSEFVKWKLPCYMDIRLCEVYYDNPLLLLRYCPNWLMERPPIPDPIDLTHPTVVAAGRVSYALGGMVQIDPDEEEKGELLNSAVEKAENEGMVRMGEVFLPGGWVIDNMPLNEKIWNCFIKKSHPNYIYVLTYEEPNWERILPYWPSQAHGSEASVMGESTENEETINVVVNGTDKIEKMKTLFNFGGNDSQTEGEDFILDFPEDIVDILNESLGEMLSGDKELDVKFEESKRENTVAYYTHHFHSGDLSGSQSVIRAAYREWPSARYDIATAVESSPSMADYKSFPLKTVHSFNRDNFPVGPQLQRVPDCFINKCENAEFGPEASTEEQSRTLYEYFIQFIKIIQELKDFINVVSLSQCTVRELVVTGKKADDILKEIMDELYQNFRKKPRELQEFELDGIIQSYEAEKVAYDAKTAEDEEEENQERPEEKNEDIRIFGESGPFCVVSLERGLLLKGKTDFMVKYNGKLYSFWNEEAKEEFLRNTEKYSPFYSVIRSLPPVRIWVMGATGCGKTTLSDLLARNCSLRPVNYINFFNKILLPHLSKGCRKFTALEDETLYLSEEHNEAARTALQKFLALPPFLREYWLENPPNYPDEEYEQKSVMRALEIFLNPPDMTQLLLKSSSDEISDDSEHLNFRKIESLLKKYVEDDFSLPDELVEKIYKTLWENQDYASTGFIIDEFPFRPSDLVQIQRNKLYPDIILEMILPEDKAVGRSLKTIMSAWKVKLNNEILEEKKVEDLLFAVRETFMEARRIELILERAVKFSFSTAESQETELSAEVEVLHGEGGEISRNEGSDLTEVFTDEHREEMEKILLQEFPELEFNPIFETYDAASERLQARLSENYRKELKYIDEMKSELSMLNIPWITVDSQKSIIKNFIEITRRLDGFRKRIGQKCEYTFQVDLATAEELLNTGYYFISRFGRRCPVQMYRMKNPVNMYEPYSEKGKVFAVVYRNYIYFICGKNETRKFMENPIKYIFTGEGEYANIPLRIAVIGPPKSGKTTLAKKLAETFSLKVLSMGSAIRFVLDEMGHSHLAKSMEGYLRRGCFLPLRLKMKAVRAALNDPKCFTQGFVLDGFPYDAATAENLAENGKLPFVILSLTSDSIFGQENRKKLHLNNLRLNFKQRLNLDLKYEEWNESYSKFLQWNRSAYNNIYPVEANKSICEVFYRSCRIVLESYAGILRYFRECIGNKPVPLKFLCVSSHEFAMRKSVFGKNCPVCWRELKVLNCPGDSRSEKDGLFQYLNFFYWVCPDHVERFFERPKKYLPPLSSCPPDVLPRAAEKEKDRELPIYGSGRCSVAKRDFPGSLNWEGSWEYGVEYGGKIYLCKNEVMRRRFLRRPWRYDTVDTEYDKYSRNRSEAITVLGPPKLASLPPVGFLEQTVAKTIQNSLTIVGKIRPIYPNMNPATTGCAFVALLIKISTSSSEAILGKKYLKFMFKHCPAVKYTMVSFEKSADHEYVMGWHEADRELCEMSSGSMEEEIFALDLSKQNIGVDVTPTESHWAEVEVQSADQGVWNAPILPSTTLKMTLTADGRLEEIPDIPKHRVMLKFQTYGLRTAPLPPVPGCLNYLYTPRADVVVPDEFDYRSLYQRSAEQISEFPPAVIFNPHKEFSMKLYNETQIADQSESHVYQPNVSESINSDFEINGDGTVSDPYTAYMMKNFIPRFHILDPLPYVEIPGVPHVIEDDIVLYNPHRDFTYCLLFAQFFRLSHYLQIISMDASVEFLEYLSILDRKFELPVRPITFKTPHITKSSLSRKSIANYQNTFDAACSFFIPDYTEKYELTSTSESSKDSLTKASSESLYMNHVEHSFQDFIWTGEASESFEISMARDGPLDRVPKPTIVLREILPYPPLPWDTVCRPYYTYCSIPSVFSVPDIESVVHERNVSLLDGITDPNDEFRLIRFPTWVQKGADLLMTSRMLETSKLDIPNSNSPVGPKIALYYEFLNFHWSTLITYPFSWAFNMDLKDNWDTLTLTDETPAD